MFCFFWGVSLTLLNVSYGKKPERQLGSWSFLTYKTKDWVSAPEPLCQDPWDSVWDPDEEGADAQTHSTFWISKDDSTFSKRWYMYMPPKSKPHEKSWFCTIFLPHILQVIIFIYSLFIHPVLLNEISICMDGGLWNFQKRRFENN